jgi:GT2 family glycosyltransferase
MTLEATDRNGKDSATLPSVTIVFLVYNRREQLRESLRRMTVEADYEQSKLDVIVVDNASDDGSAEMVRTEFPAVQVIVREVNCGVSGWNDGFAAARGDYVLALDDDCYLPPDGLRRAVETAVERDADLVSFSVRSSFSDDYRFDQSYRTGLLSFWGCAVLMRRGVLDALDGYDPEIFVWANELEFMLRFFDHGFRHLHLPEVQAIHMKLPKPWTEYLPTRAYRINARHFAYIAAKLLRPREAVQLLVALPAAVVRDAIRTDRRALKALPHSFAGYIHGLRRRQAISSPAVSRTFRRNLESFASPWWVSRPLRQVVLGLPAELVRRARGRSGPGSRPPGRREQYYVERARYYPDSAETLQF